MFSKELMLGVFWLWVSNYPPSTSKLRAKVTINVELLSELSKNCLDAPVSPSQADLALDGSRSKRWAVLRSVTEGEKPGGAVGGDQKPSAPAD